MNYTENYHLPQWEETDRIMRTDFNEAMANIDGGIAETLILSISVDTFNSKICGTYATASRAAKNL